MIFRQPANQPKEITNASGTSDCKIKFINTRFCFLCVVCEFRRRRKIHEFKQEQLSRRKSSRRSSGHHSLPQTLHLKVDSESASYNIWIVPARSDLENRQRALRTTPEIESRHVRTLCACSDFGSRRRETLRTWLQHFRRRWPGLPDNGHISEGGTSKAWVRTTRSRGNANN